MVATGAMACSVSQFYITKCFLLDLACVHFILESPIVKLFRLFVSIYIVQFDIF